MAHHRSTNIWLILCATLVFCMVIIGGLTRLSESGLSIVEWKVVSGILPPLGEESWQKEFTAYQATPQYIKINNHMQLEDFKQIFWLEYIHRLLGRLVGLCYALPLLYFAIKKAAPPRILRAMFGICLLVGAQGAVGWYMVKSGLVDNPAVSQYRLAFHLCLAILIFALTLWQWLRHNSTTTIKSPSNTQHVLCTAILTMLAIQIFMGALVAGLDAGLTYNTFPLIDGSWLPEGLHSLTPAWRNHTENILTVQFQHRVTAFAILTLALILRFNYRKQEHTCTHAICLTNSIILTILIQIIFGVLTLLMVVPTHLAVSHQAIAVILIALVLALWHEQRYPRNSTKKQ